MDSIREEAEKPTLYAGFRIPFDRLSPDAFEGFSYLALLILGEKSGYHRFQKTGGSGDGGFDLDCERVTDSQKVCIQCKRYTDTQLGLDSIGAELAKSALRAFIDNAMVAENFIVTAGKVRQIVRQALRESNRESLLKPALKAVGDLDSLKNLLHEVRPEAERLPI